MGRNDPKILWNAKDAHYVGSGYGNITKHLVPRLADHFGKDRIVVFAPVFNKDRVEYWNGIRVLPGRRMDYGEDVMLEHYNHEEATMLFMVGDFMSLNHVFEWAARDQIVWCQWAPWDWLNESDYIRQLCRTPTMLVGFTKYAEQRFRDAAGESKNVYPAIPIGLDTTIWRPIDRREMPTVMSDMGFSDDTYNIFIVANNQRRKFLREQFEAIRMFSEARPDANPRLYLHSPFESGEYDLNYQLESAKIKDITTRTDPYQYLLGGLPEDALCKMFNCADVVMNVSFEGFGMSVTQAQAVGVPVIGLREGPFTELCKVGVAVRANHVDYTSSETMEKPVALPEDIAESLTVLYDAGTRKSEEPMAFIRENFDWDVVADQWIWCIEEVHRLRERHTMYVPEPSPELLAKAKKRVEVSLA